jgi:hypothetical protein
MRKGDLTARLRAMEKNERVVSQAFGLRLLTSEVRFHFQDSGICGGQSGRGRVCPLSD